MGKEWYRFPSNFFLPSNNWNVKFIKSEFKGQLPQPYLTEKAHATATERPNFNNLNLEELDRYVKVKCPVCLCYEIVVLWSCRKKVVVSKNSLLTFLHSKQIFCWSKTIVKPSAISIRFLFEELFIVITIF